MMYNEGSLLEENEKSCLVGYGQRASIMGSKSILFARREIERERERERDIFVLDVESPGLI